MPQRNAASVFPDPVGAQIRVCAPDAIAGQPEAWAGVGASNDASNQRRTGFEKGSRGDFWVADVLMANLLTLPTAPLGPPGAAKPAPFRSRGPEGRRCCSLGLALGAD